MIHLQTNPTYTSLLNNTKHIKLAKSSKSLEIIYFVNTVSYKIPMLYLIKSGPVG